MKNKNTPPDKKVLYVPMRMFRWSALAIYNAGSPRAATLKEGDRVEDSIGFLPVYDSLGAFTKHWGGDAPYITIETISDESP